MSEASSDRKALTAICLAYSVCLVMLVLFLGTWLVHGKRIKDSRRFATLVPQFLAKGDVERALEIARIASEREPNEPEAQYLHAKSLMANGQREAALRRYENLFHVDMMPNPAYDPDFPELAPGTVVTVRPFFHPEARFEVGRYYLEEGDFMRAVHNFELARAFGQEMDIRWHPPLYSGYANLGTWGRAFEYAGIDLDLTSLSADALRTLARVCAYHEDWPRCKEAARLLLDHEGVEGEAYFWLGRACLALNEMDNGFRAFEEAVNAGYADALFFLGLVKEAQGLHEEAKESFLAVLPGSLYRPFSLAKALAIVQGRIDKLLSHEEAPVNAGQQAASNAMELSAAPLEKQIRSIKDELRTVLARPLTGPRPRIQGDPRVRPRGLQFASDTASADTPFPVLISWLSSDVPPPPEHFTVHTRVGNTIKLQYAGRMLELRWVTNLVPFGDFQALPTPPNQYPGWLEGYWDTKEGRWRHRSDFERAEVGPPLEVTTTVESERILCESVFLPCDTAQYYLFAVLCKSGGARLVAGWNWYDREDNRVYTNNAINQRVVENWRWAALYSPVPEDAAYVQASVGIHKDMGAALFDAVLIVPLDPPDWL